MPLAIWTSAEYHGEAEENDDYQTNDLEDRCDVLKPGEPLVGQNHQNCEKHHEYGDYPCVNRFERLIVEKAFLT